MFDIKFGKIVITANSDIGKIEETVSAELEGKELKVAMNSKYLLDAVKALEEEQIILSFNLMTPIILTIFSLFGGLNMKVSKDMKISLTVFITARIHLEFLNKRVENIH